MCPSVRTSPRAWIEVPSRTRSLGVEEGSEPREETGYGGRRLRVGLGGVQGRTFPVVRCDVHGRGASLRISAAWDRESSPTQPAVVICSGLLASRYFDFVTVERQRFGGIPAGCVAFKTELWFVDFTFDGDFCDLIAACFPDENELAGFRQCFDRGYFGRQRTGELRRRGQDAGPFDFCPFFARCGLQEKPDARGRLCGFDFTEFTSERFRDDFAVVFGAYTFELTAGLFLGFASGERQDETANGARPGDFTDARPF